MFLALESTASHSEELINIFTLYVSHLEDDLHF